MSELRERLVNALETVIKNGVADPVDGTHYITAELVLEVINGTPNDDIIYCKDCKEYDPIYTGGAGVCGHWNAKTENNSYCSYVERRTDVSN